MTHESVVQSSANISKQDICEATCISLNVKSGKTDEFAAFLKVGAKLVKETEPNTKLWFALKETDDQFAIFDVFPDEAGRTAHFEGQVAGALKEQAPNLIVGGWDEGVVSNVHNFEILSSKFSSESLGNKATEATYIRLEANEGKEDELEALLTGAAKVIEETEPKTLFWVALKLDDNTYGIFDTFTDDSGRQAHFAGGVAAALQQKASELVKGGWDQGVLTNVHNFTIIASA